MILSVCIRCCIQASANNTQPIRSRRNPRLTRVQVHSYQNNSATRSSTAVPVHCIQEDAPPSYAVATSTEYPKY